MLFKLLRTGSGHAIGWNVICSFLDTNTAVDQYVVGGIESVLAFTDFRPLRSQHISRHYTDRLTRCGTVNFIMKCWLFSFSRNWLVEIFRTERHNRFKVFVRSLNFRRFSSQSSSGAAKILVNDYGYMAYPSMVLRFLPPSDLLPMGELHFGLLQRILARLQNPCYDDLHSQVHVDL